MERHPSRKMQGFKESLPTEDASNLNHTQSSAARLVLKDQDHSGFLTDFPEGMSCAFSKVVHLGSSKGPLCKGVKERPASPPPLPFAPGDSEVLRPYFPALYLESTPHSPFRMPTSPFCSLGFDSEEK